MFNNDKMQSLISNTIDIISVYDFLTWRHEYEASLEPYEEERHTCSALIKYLQKFQAEQFVEPSPGPSPGVSPSMYYVQCFDSVKMEHFIQWTTSLNMSSKAL